MDPADTHVGNHLGIIVFGNRGDLAYHVRSGNMPHNKDAALHGTNLQCRVWKRGTQQHFQFPSVAQDNHVHRVDLVFRIPQIDLSDPRTDCGNLDLIRCNWESALKHRDCSPGHVEYHLPWRARDWSSQPVPSAATVPVHGKARDCLKWVGLTFLQAIT